MDWPLIQTGAPANPNARTTMSTGNGLMPPLDAAARRIGVQYLLDHKMTSIYRENGNSGRVIGVAADNKGNKGNIRARKAVIIATGGSTGNVNFRRMFDPRLTEEYCGLAGMPYSDQDASGEIAAMAIGASLWGLFNQTAEHGSTLTKPGQIGTQYGYVNLRWQPSSPMFDKARATGLRVADWQDQLPQRQEHPFRAEQLDQRRHGRHRRRPQRRRPDLGDFRCSGGRAREVGSEAAERRHRRRVLLRRRYDRGTGEEDRDEASACADTAT
jgi:hypothetical protein